MERVHEPDLAGVAAGATYLRGEWCEQVFAQDAPLTLELGCGQGMFAAELARRFPSTNVVGVDLKGHRFWRGAKAVHVGGCSTQRSCAPVSSGWITSSGPVKWARSG